MKNRRKKKRESGQAMVEFALVLPIFLLLVMGILDFGFLFYNYISLENSARNAARIACVSYTNVAIDHSDSSPKAFITDENGVKEVKRVLTLPVENATASAAYTVDPYNKYSTEEVKICMEVAQALDHTGIDREGRKITISYSYDTSPELETDREWKAKDRYNGDVSVTVNGEAHVLTPVLGVTADHMLKPLASKSVFKVEEQYTD